MEYWWTNATMSSFLNTWNTKRNNVWYGAGSLPSFMLFYLGCSVQLFDRFFLKGGKGFVYSCHLVGVAQQKVYVQPTPS